MFLHDRNWNIFEYSVREYPFRPIIQLMLSRRKLEKLALPDVGVLEQKKDQSTIYHRKFYDHWGIMLPMYRKFIRKIIRPLFAEPIIYQTIPTFRVHLRNNVAVGEFHKDTDYGHSPEEINFWLPVTEAYGSNSVQFIPHDGTTHFVSGDVHYGQFLVFNAGRLHGNLINKTPITRVSFDFRAYEKSKFVPTDKVSVSYGMKFAIGSYWTELKE